VPESSVGLSDYSENANTESNRGSAVSQGFDKLSGIILWLSCVLPLCVCPSPDARDKLTALSATPFIKYLWFTRSNLLKARPQCAKFCSTGASCVFSFWAIRKGNACEALPSPLCYIFWIPRGRHFNNRLENFLWVVQNMQGVKVIYLL